MLYKGIGSKLSIDKNDFYNEIKKSKEQDKLTDKAVDYIIKMAVHGVRHGNLFYQDSRDEEDCIQAAIYDALKRWRSFDETQYSDPFAFFSSVVFNGYANQFKMIHRHRFVKSSMPFHCEINGPFDIERIKHEIRVSYSDATDEVRARDIKRVQVRFKSPEGEVGKWITVKLDNLDVLSEYSSDFPTVEFFDVKFDYNGQIDFINLDQSSNDSEIFNI